MQTHRRHNQSTQQLTGGPEALITSRPTLAGSVPRGIESHFASAVPSEAEILLPPMPAHLCLLTQRSVAGSTEPSQADGRTDGLQSAGPVALSAHDEDQSPESRCHRAQADEGRRASPEDRGDVRRGDSVLEGHARHRGRSTPHQLASSQGMIFADASFLVAFFAGGHFHREAVRWWQNSQAVLTVSKLVLFEAENSMRTLPLKGNVSQAAATRGIEMMKRAILEGLIEVRALRVARVYPHGLRLSAHYAERRSFGAVDLLHVATALDLGAREFLTFDQDQGDLARLERLHVLP